jgi:membrane protein required for colicin V production
MDALGWVDAAMLGVLGLSMLVGTWRGLTFELMSLAGWVVAYIAGQAFSPLVGTTFTAGAPGSPLHQALAFGATFVAALVVWAVLARLARLLVHATPLTAVDRLLGAVFGVLRGVLVLLVVATVVAFTPAARSASWTVSHGASWLGVLLAGLKPVLPDEMARHLPA